MEQEWWHLTVQTDRTHETTATVPQMICKNVMGKRSSFFSLKMSILALCIMRLNWFYYKTSAAVRKQFIPNPSITFKCKFPWVLRCNSTSAINCILHSYFCLIKWNFFSCLFISTSISESMFDCKPQACTRYRSLLWHMLFFQTFTHFQTSGLI